MERIHISIPALALLFASIAGAAEQSLESEVSIQSPTLVRLSEAIARNGNVETERFWKQVADRHTPLVEELANRPDDALYTFLWRGVPNDSTFAVRLIASLPRYNKPGPEKLTRLAASDVWYASFVLPKRATVGYAFVVPTNSKPAAQVTGVEQHDGVEYGQCLDPLNPNTVQAIGATVSFAEGPLAKSSLYLLESPGVAKGTIETVEIQSKVLEGPRRIDVYRPAGYETTSGTYRFVLMYDGDEYTKSIPTPRILDNMIASKAIAPAVVAFFHSPDRDKDLLPSENFQRFVADEFVPFIRDRYRVSKDPKRNVVAGYSLGGLAAADTAVRNPALFGNVIAQSGSFWWGSEYWKAPDYSAGQYLNSNSMGFIKMLAERPRLPIRFYLEAGEWEEAAALLPSRLLSSVLKGKGYQVSYSEYLGAHNSFDWKQTLPDALIYVLKP